MPGTESQGSFLNRISIRRNQIASLDNSDHDHEDHDAFLRHVSDRFSALLPSSAADPPPLLSIAWLHQLLDAFLSCEAQFKALLIYGRDPAHFSRPPLDRLVPDLLEKSVKSLDVFNAVTNGLDLLHHWQKLAQIATSALRQTPVGEGQVRRARKALTTLLVSMSFDDKEISSSFTHKSTDRAKSFVRRLGRDRGGGGVCPRSMAWSVAKSWSAARQVQTMVSGLATLPRGAEGGGAAVAAYVFNTVLVFVVWAMVAAVPCQERGGMGGLLLRPMNGGGGLGITALQEKIGEEWRRREKKGAPGLMEELQRMERVAHSLVEFADGFVFPMEGEKAVQVAAQVEELAEVCRKMEEGLGPLQQQVRDVFHRIVKSRGEILDVLDQVSKLSAPVQY